MTSLIQDPKTGLRYRPDTDDYATIKEATGVYKDVPVQPGDTVLDLGAHIGSSVYVWLQKGARHVWACEPELENLRVLKANHGEDHRVSIMPLAVAEYDGVTDLFVSPAGKAFHTLVRWHGKTPQA